MVNLISTGSNYIIIIMGVIYAISCFTVFLPSSEKVQAKRMDRQELFMFLFHFICYGVLFVKTLDTKLIFLYAVQVAFFKLLIFIYSRVYVDCSRILMNHTCFLLLIGFVMLTRLSFDKAVKQFAIAAGTSVIVLFIPYFMQKAAGLKRLKWVYGILGLLFLASVFVIGTSQNGATNWISIGGFSLQPSELAKIIFVFFVAAMLARNTEFKRIVITTAAAAAYVLILVVENDLGAALIFFVTYLVMLYVATRQFRYMALGLGAGSGAAVMAYKLFGHVQVRVTAWKDPWGHYNDAGYQIAQSLFAIGTGGWFGMGLFKGKPDTIPVVVSDFVFSAISEEMGALFAICLILVYFSCFLMFINISLQLVKPFYKLIAMGLSTAYGIQLFLCIGGVTKLIPHTGVTMPLISYGGSSVLSTIIIFAVIQGLYLLRQREGYILEKRREERLNQEDRPENKY